MLRGTFWPIAKHGLDKSQRRDCGRIRAQDARAQAQAQHARRRKDRGAFGVVESAFRPNQEADAAIRARIGEGVERARLLRLLVAENEKALGGPTLERFA